MVGDFINIKKVYDVWVFYFYFPPHWLPDMIMKVWFAYFKDTDISGYVRYFKMEFKLLQIFTINVFTIICIAYLPKC